MPMPIWKIETLDQPLVATAIHAGSGVRDELLEYMALDPASRLREEDPHTDLWTAVAPNRVVGQASRFQVDLNRPREKAVYLTPEDAWGLKVWKRDLPKALVERSLAEYDAFYEELNGLFSGLHKRYGHFVVFDLHSYNHRREGPNGPPAEPDENPQLNVGTGTMTDRSRWEPVIDALMESMRKVGFPSGPLDVRENVRFRGGQMARWTHTLFPNSACVLSLEFKKFFMDEWTGIADTSLIGAIEEALGLSIDPVLEALKTTKS